MYTDEDTSKELLVQIETPTQLNVWMEGEQKMCICVNIIVIAVWEHLLI